MVYLGHRVISYHEALRKIHKSITVLKNIWCWAVLEIVRKSWCYFNSLYKLFSYYNSYQRNKKGNYIDANITFNKREDIEESQQISIAELDQHYLNNFQPRVPKDNSSCCKMMFIYLLITYSLNRMYDFAEGTSLHLGL